jgi:tetratricopeptide (TPR) repeat protein
MKHVLIKKDAMRLLVFLLLFSSQLFSPGLKAQQHTRINERIDWIKRVSNNKNFKAEDADLLYNVASMYALTGDKDSAFHYLFRALKMCPDSLDKCKEVYNADILGDICFKSLSTDKRWKLFEKNIKTGFLKINSGITHPDVAYQLLIAKGYEQTARFYYQYLNEQQKSAISGLNIDSLNLILVTNVIKKYGFPTIPMVGAAAAHAAFLLCQHADEDLNFQKKVLGLMEQSAHDVDPADLAYLTDRVMVAEKGVQLYGTQFLSLKDRTLYPIQDASEVDVRRKKMGLSTLKEYINSFHTPGK